MAERWVGGWVGVHDSTERVSGYSEHLSIVVPEVCGVDGDTLLAGRPPVVASRCLRWWRWRVGHGEGPLAQVRPQEHHGVLGLVPAQSHAQAKRQWARRRERRRLTVRQREAMAQPSPGREEEEGPGSLHQLAHARLHRHQPRPAAAQLGQAGAQSLGECSQADPLRRRPLVRVVDEGLDARQPLLTALQQQQRTACEGQTGG